MSSAIRRARPALCLAAAAALAGPGTAAAHARPAKVTGQQTVITLSDAAAGALTQAGVTVGTVGKATASDAGVAFPVAGGRVNAKLTRGWVRHRGGVSLTKGTTTARLVRPTAVVTRRHAFIAVQLRARVLRAFRLTGLKKTTDGTTTTITATVRLTRPAARLFNRAFGTSFRAGVAAGTATSTLTTG